MAGLVLSSAPPSVAQDSHTGAPAPSVSRVATPYGPRVLITDPRGDVTGDATHADTIDVFNVKYRVKTPGNRPSLNVRVRYRQILPAEVGRQSLVTKIRVADRSYAVVLQANGYDSVARLYRVTDEGWRQTHVVVWYVLNFSGGKGMMQVSIPIRVFRADAIDRVQTRLRLVDGGGRATDRTRPHLEPISLVP
jgi:hypothetical protein